MTCKSSGPSSYYRHKYIHHTLFHPLPLCGSLESAWMLSLLKSITWKRCSWWFHRACKLPLPLSFVKSSVYCYDLLFLNLTLKIPKSYVNCPKLHLLWLSHSLSFSFLEKGKFMFLSGNLDVWLLILEASFLPFRAQLNFRSLMWIWDHRIKSNYFSYSLIV